MAAWKESLRIVIIIVVRFLFDTGKNVKVDNRSLFAQCLGVERIALLHVGKEAEMHLLDIVSQTSIECSLAVLGTKGVKRIIFYVVLSGIM